MGLARPIIFSGAMVRAILDGRKTQTRRIVKGPIGFIGGRGQEADPECWGWFFDGPEHNGYMVVARRLNERHNHGLVSIRCPYGDAGDELYVRETWSRLDARFRPNEPVAYRADGEREGQAGFWGWKPSIHMPTWASRIRLRVTGVRVERLNAITDADAKAEGFASRDSFILTWCELYGLDAWEQNPWVWVVSFDRVKP